MAILSPEKRIVCKGRFGTVEFAVSPPDQMAETLEWKENLPENKWRSFRVLFTRLVDEGVIHNEQQFRSLDGDVWEFKRGGDRLLCYRSGNRYLLTNTLKKSGRKNIKTDIKRAFQIGTEHVAWESSQKSKKTTQSIKHQ